MLLNKNLVLSALLCIPLPVSAFAAAKCEKSSCLHLVRQGKKAGGRGGCRKFLETTIILPTVTTTLYSATVLTTITVTPTSPSDFDNQRRLDIKPIVPASTTTTSQTTVPNYAASVCTNTVQYSSACSCVGASSNTVTSTPSVNVPAGATTSTVTVTQTTSSCTIIPTPTQVVQDSGFELLGYGVANDWSLNGDVSVADGSGTAYDFDYMITYHASPVPGSVQQFLATAAYESPINYTFTAEVSQTGVPSGGAYQISATLGDHQLIPLQDLCSADSPCDQIDVDSTLYTFRYISATGTFDSLDENPLLTVVLTSTFFDNGGSMALLDNVQLTLSC